MIDEFFVLVLMLSFLSGFVLWVIFIFNIGSFVCEMDLKVIIFCIELILDILKNLDLNIFV